MIDTQGEVVRYLRGTTPFAKLCFQRQVGSVFGNVGEPSLIEAPVNVERDFHWESAPGTNSHFVPLRSLRFQLCHTLLEPSPCPGWSANDNRLKSKTLARYLRGTIHFRPFAKRRVSGRGPVFGSTGQISSKEFFLPILSVNVERDFHWKSVQPSPPSSGTNIVTLADGMIRRGGVVRMGTIRFRGKRSFGEVRSAHWGVI